MIPGIIAQDTDISAAAPADPFSGSAASFSGTSGFNGQCAIKLASITATNNGFMGWSGWFRSAWFPAGNPSVWSCDSAGSSDTNFHANGSTQFEFDVGNGSRSWSCNIGAADSTAFLTNNVWQHIIGAADVNHAAGLKFIKIYVDGVDASANATGSNGTAWQFTLNGKDFFLGDDGFGNSFDGGIADFSFWPGVNFFTAGDISSTTREHFRDAGGNPVDPATTIAAMGVSPAIMCTGGVTGFLANALGTSGALTVPAGYDSPTNI